MARAVDPKSRVFIETTKLPKGRYEGKTLCYVARTEVGLLYLNNLITNHKTVKWMTKRLLSHIMAFFDTNERLQALSIAIENQVGKKTK